MKADQIPAAAQKHYDRQRQITGGVLTAALVTWGENPPADPDRWLSDNTGVFTAILSAGQQAAVSSSQAYVADSLAETGAKKATKDLAVDASTLVGISSDGRPVVSALYSPIDKYKAAVSAHAAEDDLDAEYEHWTRTGSADDLMVQQRAWRNARDTSLVVAVQTQVADAERAATGLEITTRQGVGYTRLVRSGACPRCTVLAGRFYKWNDGFLRHPNCSCRHIPATEDTAPGLISDPREAFDALSEEEQNKIFTVAGAQAIRDGANLGQVVNARRGSKSGLDTAGRNVYGRNLITTTEGTTKRGFAGKIIRDRGRTPATSPRLMPEDIYEIAEDRDDALRLLELNGYAFDPSKAKNRGSLTRKPAPKPGDPVDLDAEQIRIDREALDKLDADAAELLAAEAARPLSATTRVIIDSARSTLPQGKADWRNLESLREDINGNLLPSAELVAHLDTVTATGRAVRADVTRRMDTDPVLIEQRALADPAAYAAERDRLLSAGDFGALFAADARSNAAQEAARIAVARRESEIIREALADVREFGGHQQGVHTLSASERSTLTTVGKRPVAPVDADAVAMLREAEQFYPRAWLEAADARGPLALGYVERGYFLEQHPTTLDTDSIAISRRGTYPYRSGAHSDEATETMIHELGHRMEKAIPGLTQLEFALARKRATRNGVLDELTEINEKTPGEVTYEDQWANPYAGRSYSRATDPRPDLAAHEVFQVGTQDLFGRSTDRYGDDELQEFMMGVLALL